MVDNILLEQLKKENELFPNEYDGSYELMQTTIEMYAELDSYDYFDYKDLDLIYLMAVGTFKDGLESKKNRVRNSKLPHTLKDRLLTVMDNVWDKACMKQYGNWKHLDGKVLIGMFGTGFLSFKRFEDDLWNKQITEVIKMLIDIRNLENDEEIYKRAELILNQPIKGIKAASVSIMLHCLKPFSFPIINGNEGMGDIYEELGIELINKKSAQTYIDNCRKIKQFRDDNNIAKNYRVFDLYARKILEDRRKNLWPSKDEYPYILTKEQWIEFINEDRVSYPSTLKMLMYMNENGKEASCKKLADALGGKPSAYISRGSNFAKRAKEKYNLPACLDENGKEYLFPIAFLGHKVKTDEESELYSWVLREELSEALDEIDFEEEETVVKVEFDHNIILYGPPGTGKTYNSARYAVAICEELPLEEINKWEYSEVLSKYNELKEEGRVAFTTFHQSYGYEEFIEGIKPVVASEDAVNSGESLQYVIADGVFKKFCNESDLDDMDTNAFDNAWEKLIKSVEENDNKYTFTRRTGSNFTANLVSEERLRVWWSGGTFNDLTFDAVKKLWIEGESNEIDKLKNGTKWLYVARLAVIDELVNKYGLPKEVTVKKRNKVFIIDEINRGNISKIFGELITLIENTKRNGMPEAASTTLPYSGEQFSVPSNVYILGTMNTADRSIALMDTALRRRFSFVEMMPDSQVLVDIEANIIEVDNFTINIANMLDVINKRIECLYDREHTIGHAFFTGLKDDYSIEKLAMIFKKNIIPLLQEYFYEDYSKIQLVLGDNQKTSDKYKFILNREKNVDEIFNGHPDLDLAEEQEYIIQDEAFYLKESYKEIGKNI